MVGIKSNCLIFEWGAMDAVNRSCVRAGLVESVARQSAESNPESPTLNSSQQHLVESTIQAVSAQEEAPSLNEREVVVLKDLFLGKKDTFGERYLVEITALVEKLPQAEREHFINWLIPFVIAQDLDTYRGHLVVKAALQLPFADRESVLSSSIMLLDRGMHSSAISLLFESVAKIAPCDRNEFFSLAKQLVPSIVDSIPAAMCIVSDLPTSISFEEKKALLEDASPLLPYITSGARREFFLLLSKIDASPTPEFSAGTRKNIIYDVEGLKRALFDPKLRSFAPQEFELLSILKCFSLPSLDAKKGRAIKLHAIRLLPSPLNEGEASHMVHILNRFSIDEMKNISEITQNLLQGRKKEMHNEAAAFVEIIAQIPPSKREFAIAQAVCKGHIPRNGELEKEICALSELLTEEYKEEIYKKAHELGPYLPKGDLLDVVRVLLGAPKGHYGYGVFSTGENGALPLADQGLILSAIAPLSQVDRDNILAVMSLYISKTTPVSAAERASVIEQLAAIPLEEREQVVSYAIEERISILESINWHLAPELMKCVRQEL